MNDRSPVPAPALGVHRAIPAEHYHRIHAMSAGGLKRMAQSPAHFYGMQLDPNRPPEGEPSAALRNGTLTHCAVLEPDQVDARYIARPEGLDARTKEGKAWIAAQTREVVTPAELAAAKMQAQRIRALPDVAALLSVGYAESSAFWIDEPTGELCKCRPDWVSPAGDGVILLDVKTCQSASPEEFSRTVWNFDYHLQAAWYSDGFEKASGLKVYGFVFPAVESAWPHQAAAYMLDDSALEKARAKNRELLDLYAECKRAGAWPGYPASIQPLALPAWVK